MQAPFGTRELMNFPRRSGILLHPTALPGPYGIGDLGAEAYAFVEFLARAGQGYWQVLPLSPTGFADSPYQGLSAFAGNPLLISPQKLVEAGHLELRALGGMPVFPADRAEFGRAIPCKTALLHKAFACYKGRASSAQQESFAQFCQRQSSWLEDFSLFAALKQAHHLQEWRRWPPDLATRQPQALQRSKAALAEAIEFEKYQQWQFFEQWQALKRYANERGVRIIGDVPIFVAMDSADVWAHPRLFHFDAQLNPIVVSGVPPDYFSTTGQLWGHPLYRWDVMAQDGYAWWLKRFDAAFAQADVVRIDHFRGFYNYWEIPAGEKTAVRGRWLPGPGAAFFQTVAAKLGETAIIAEDLGDFDVASRSGVDALQARFGFPGMKVIQFAFGSGPSNPFLPHHFSHPNCIAYTGTHDNDTVTGWYRTANAAERDFCCKYLGRDSLDIAWDLIRLAWSSVAHTAITSAQDLLGLGSEARFNTPSTCGPPNWCWRLLPGALDDRVAERLGELTEIYGRKAR